MILESNNFGPFELIFTYSGIKRFASIHHLQHKLMKKALKEGTIYNGWKFYPLNNEYRY